MENRPLFNFDRPPILFIGSGISKRYLVDYKSWEELLKSVAKRIGINERRFMSFVQLAEDSSNVYGTFPNVATNLRRELLEGLKTGSFEAESIFNTEELEMYDDGVDAFKILVSSEVSSYSIRDIPLVREEIELLRSLINIIPSIITTNYDCFLENEIFKEFKTFSSISDYYFSEAHGIGEIYKIHGSIESPDSLIIREEDYAAFDRNSKIISAKILSILCDYPMLIIGYSMDDVNIKEIIHNLMSSLNDDRLKELENNIYYISYDETKSEPVHGKTGFEYEGRQLILSSIETNDFKTIFEEISSYLPSTTPSEIRKLRQLVKNIVLTSEPSINQFLKVNIDDIDNLKSDNIVLIVSDVEYANAIKEHLIITTDTIIRDVLLDGIRLDPKIVLKHFIEYPSLFNSNSYIPIYPYVAKDDNMHARVSKFLKTKEEQFFKMLEKIKKQFSNRTINKKDIYKGLRTDQRPQMVIHLLTMNEISCDEALEYLKADYKIHKNSTRSTNYKFSITYITYLKFN